MTTTHNIAEALREQAALAPDRIALHYPSGSTGFGAMSFRKLDEDSNALAAGLAAVGVGRGVRTALMVKPGPEFFVLIYALFKSGAIPVLIDPGIDRRALRTCLAEAAPQAFIGIPLAHAARIALGWARRSVRVLVTVGRRWFWGGHTYETLLRRGAATRAAGDSAYAGVEEATGGDELAAILFTSGSTGIPKGVEYTHANFFAQLQLIRRAFDMRAGETDLATFAPFALFDPALGMTCVLPRMDFARPGRVAAGALADAVVRFGATTMFGSPAVLEVLARGGGPHATQLAGLARIVSAGAPVRPEVVESLGRVLPAAVVWTPYGATECLPVSVVEGRDILALGALRTPQGAGILVGTPLPENTVRIIRIQDAPIAAWTDELVLPTGEVGEITVAGPSATARYYAREGATAAAKIMEPAPLGGSPRVVHRMGDLGYFDLDGMLWYCGRKSHRVRTGAGTMYTEQVEGVFNSHRAVRRTALVGVGAAGAQTAVLCVELASTHDARHWDRVRGELAELGAGNMLTRPVAVFLRHPGFPVDIRHNAKIGRERLAAWAASRLL